MIIIVFGLPGSGKSYFASHLAGVINAEHVNSDKIRKTMLDTRTYSKKEKLAVYNEMISRIGEAIEQHKNLVLDATFYKNDIREKFLNKAENNDDIIFIEIRAEEHLIRERLKRPREYSEADFKVYEKIKNQWEPLKAKHLILQSTNSNIRAMLKKTADYLHLKDDKRTN
jgi:predicted kinase